MTFDLRTLGGVRVPLLLGVVALALAAATACDEEDEVCPNGVWPFDGQTAVPTDVAIVFRTGEPLAPDLPPIEGTVHLSVLYGPDIPFRAELDPEAGEIRLIPLQPLARDTVYEVEGIDWPSTASYPHHWGGYSFGRDPSETVFATGSAPSLLGVHATGDGATFVVAFSEPVRLDTLDGVLVAEQFAEVGGVDVELRILGAYEGDAHLVQVEPVGLEGYLERVALLEGARAASGAPVEPAEISVDLVLDLRSEELPRYAGLPHCTNGSW